MRLMLAACVCLLASACASVPAREGANAPHGPEVARLRQTLEALVSVGTRHTFSAPDPKRGIGAARALLVRELEVIARDSASRGGPPLRVELEPFKLSISDAPQLGEVETANVLATLPGCEESSRARKVYFVAHYDSRPGEENDAVSDAPGANDNGAAVAMLVEVARVLSRQCLPSTVVFLFSTAEEQGLYGAQHHARLARSNGEDIIAVISSDIVGDPSLPGGGRNPRDLRLFSEGLASRESFWKDSWREQRGWGTELDSPSRRLAWLARDIAHREGLALQPRLIPRPDRVMRGGDHLAFNDEGYAAIRFSQPAELYERQHANVELRDGVRYGDTLEHVDFEYLQRVAELNVALGRHLASMPREPRSVRLVMRRPSHEMLIRWEPAESASHHEVLTRPVGEDLWRETVRTSASELRVPHSPDDVVVGVRACRERFCGPVLTVSQRADD